MDTIDLVRGGEENRNLSEGEEVKSVQFSNVMKYTIKTKRPHASTRGSRNSSSYRMGCSG
jgi:hypothetical protein